MYMHNTHIHINVYIRIYTKFAHTRKQAFAAPYAPSCPVRDQYPDIDMLIHAAKMLHHNGKVYAYLAGKSREGTQERTTNEAMVRCGACRSTCTHTHISHFLCYTPLKLAYRFRFLDTGSHLHTSGRRCRIRHNDLD